MLHELYRPAGVERGILPRVVVPLLAALLVILGGGHHAAHAAENVFVIADTEGYGIMDCLTDGKSCGRVVADAWCEAHGFGAARAFGRASDVTAAIPVSTAQTKAQPDAAVVACAE